MKFNCVFYFREDGHTIKGKWGRENLQQEQGSGKSDEKQKITKQMSNSMKLTKRLSDLEINK